MKMNQSITINSWEKNKSRNRIVGRREEKTNGLLGAVIQYVKSRISGIEKNIDRIFGYKFHPSQ